MLMSVYIGTVVYFESLLDAPILLLYSIVFELLQTTGQNVALIARIQAFVSSQDFSRVLRLIKIKFLFL